MRKTMLLILIMFLMCGCSRKECVKSHKEESICVFQRCYSAGKTTTCMPYTLPCKKIICDEYREVE